MYGSRDRDVKRYTLKFPLYLGWASWMEVRPGETSLQAVLRQITWDTVVEGEIEFEITI